MPPKMLGILGGLGPMATVYFYELVTRHTKAACDQDHIHILIDNNTNIPDRTAALLSGGESPVPELQKSAARLTAMGAEGLMMPCNTAHCFHGDVQAVSEVPVLHMIELTREALEQRGVTCAGLLATNGTIQTGVYQ